MLQRLLAIVRKELISLLRDPRARMSLILPPMIQLLVFAHAATMEVKNIELAVVNLDNGPAAAEIVAQLRGSSSFTDLPQFQSVEAATHTLDREAVIGIIVLPNGLSADVVAGRTASIQLLMDGRRSNAAQITTQYISTVVQKAGMTLTHRNPASRPQLVINNWFNPNLNYKWFMLPNIIGNLTLGVALMITALSVARERELGTFDQTLVSPATPVEIALGKMIPPLIAALFQTTLFWIIVTKFFGVPFRGSIGMFYAAVLAFAASCAGIGLFVSSIAQTQQQAFLGAFAVMMPFSMLSGFSTPIENMPNWLQVVTGINPLAHMLKIMQGLFLKDASVASLAHYLIKMIAIAAVTVIASIILFRRRAN
jgi:ABC-2 type transport system permease protein